MKKFVAVMMATLLTMQAMPVYAVTLQVRPKDTSKVKVEQKIDEQLEKEKAAKEKEQAEKEKKEASSIKEIKTEEITGALRTSLSEDTSQQESQATDIQVDDDNIVFSSEEEVASALYNLVKANPVFDKLELDVYIKDDQRMQSFMYTVSKLLDLSSPYKHDMKIHTTKKDGSKYAKYTIILTPSKGEAEFRQAIKKQAEHIATKMASMPDNKSKVSYINNLIVNICDYNSNLFEDLTDANILNWSAYGVLNNNLAVCGGYANAVTVLCEEVGIPVIEVIGYATGSTVLHTWNEVYIDGEWLVIDTTANDPVGVNEHLDEYTQEELQDMHTKFLFIPEDVAYSNYYSLREFSLEQLKRVKYPELADDRIKTLQDAGILKGDNTGEMKVNEPMTKLDLAITACRISNGTKDIENDTEKYKKIGNEKFVDVPDWATQYVGYAFDKGLVSAKSEEGHTFGCQDTVSKRECLSVIDKVYNNGAVDKEYLVSTYANNGILTRTPLLHGEGASRMDMIDMIYNSLNRRQVLN